MSDIKNINSFIQTCDSFLKVGDTTKAVGLLKKLTLSKISRQNRQPLAHLCLRAGLYSRGLKVLTPIVLDKSGEVFQSAKDIEITEYAILLQKMGMVDEALGKLALVNSHKCPQALLYRAISYYNKWEYSLAVPIVEEYLKHRTLTPYQSAVGKVNMLAGLIHTRQFSKAEDLYCELVDICNRQSYQRLLANCHELWTEYFIYSERYTQALAHVNQIAPMFKNDSGRENLYFAIWRAFLDSRESNDLRPLHDYQKLAQENKYWEGVRHADYLSLKIKFDEKIFKKLLYGTPYASFQKKLINEYPFYKVEDFGKILGREKGQSLDLFNGTWNKIGVVKPGKNIHRLLYTLFSDLYRPASVGTIFSSVFAGEHFDIFSSTNKVYQLVSRLREVLKEEEIPVTLGNDGSDYSISYDENMELILPLQKVIPRQEQFCMRRLQDKYQGQYLSRQAIIDELNLSSATVARILKRSVEIGLINRSGQGRSAKYYFPSSRSA